MARPVSQVKLVVGFELNDQRSAETGKLLRDSRSTPVSEGTPAELCRRLGAVMAEHPSKLITGSSKVVKRQGFQEPQLALMSKLTQTLRILTENTSF